MSETLDTAKCDVCGAGEVQGDGLRRKTCNPFGQYHCRHAEGLAISRASEIVRLRTLQTELVEALTGCLLSCRYRDPAAYEAAKKAIANAAQPAPTKDTTVSDSPA